MGPRNTRKDAKGDERCGWEAHFTSRDPTLDADWTIVFEGHDRDGFRDRDHGRRSAEATPAKVGKYIDRGSHARCAGAIDDRTLFVRKCGHKESI
jgi:hypothetical protein